MVVSPLLIKASDSSTPRTEAYIVFTETDSTTPQHLILKTAADNLSSQHRKQSF